MEWNCISCSTPLFVLEENARENWRRLLDWYELYHTSKDASSGHYRGQSLRQAETWVGIPWMIPRLGQLKRPLWLVILLRSWWRTMPMSSSCVANRLRRHPFSEYLVRSSTISRRRTKNSVAPARVARAFRSRHSFIIFWGPTWLAHMECWAPIQRKISSTKSNPFLFSLLLTKWLVVRWQIFKNSTNTLYLFYVTKIKLEFHSELNHRLNP